MHSLTFGLTGIFCFSLQQVFLWLDFTWWWLSFLAARKMHTFTRYIHYLYFLLLSFWFCAWRISCYSQVIQGGTQESKLLGLFQKKREKTALYSFYERENRPFSKAQFSAANWVLLEMYNLDLLIVLKFALGWI